MEWVLVVVAVAVVAGLRVAVGVWRARRVDARAETPPGSYLLPVPVRHRTDWGEDFIVRLDERLMSLQPSAVDRDASGVTATLSGLLRLRIERTDGGVPIEAVLFEDEAEITSGDSSRVFRPTDAANSDDWIPAAIAYVEELVQDRR